MTDIAEIIRPDRSQAPRNSGVLNARSIFIAGLSIGLVLGLVPAETFGAPAPATRKSNHGQGQGQGQGQAHDVPDVTSPGKAAPATAKIDDDNVLVKFHLPTASRTRMHECGMKWQDMKMSGEAGDETWRVFATHCLSASNGPFEKPAP